MSRLFLALLLVFAAPGLVPVAQGQLAGQEVPGTEGVGIDDRIGERIPGDLSFTDETGAQVTIGQYFGQGRPVLLTLVYFDCPMLCHLLLDGVTAALGSVPQTPGTDFTVLTVSFSALETPAMAAQQKQRAITTLGRPQAAGGWHFLVGDEENIAALARAVGFNFRWDERSEQFAHPAAITFIDETGQINRYLAGLTFAPNDIRTALAETQTGAVGSFFEQFLMFCFQYDPDSHGYSLQVVKLMKVGGLLTMAFLGLMLTFLVYRHPTRSPIPLS